MNNVKLLIIGAGSIGKRHIKNAITLGISVNNIVVMDPREDRIEEVKKIGVIKTFTDFDLSLKEQFDAAIICSPTSLHIKQAIELARLKKHILIEKPLGLNLENINELVKIVKDNNLTVMLAYIFRFMPSIEAVKKKLDKAVIGKVLYFRGEFSEYLPDWHKYEDYRTFYMAEKKKGGGSILDQCHIMDLAHYLIGDFHSVQAANLKVSSLEISADDISEMIIRHENKVISSIHTDIFGRSHKKNLEIKGEEGNIHWDFYKNEVQIYDSKNEKLEILNEFEKDVNQSYIDELKHFITCFKEDKKNKASLEEGIHTMKLILAAEKSELSKKEELI